MRGAALFVFRERFGGNFLDSVETHRRVTPHAGRVIAGGQGAANLLRDQCVGAR